MKMWYKALCFLLAPGLLAALFACAKDEAWENEWGGLSMNDFGAYDENGDFFLGQDTYGTSGQALEEGYTTWRGVAVGDAPEKVAALYAGVECAVMDGAEPEDGEEYTELYTDFAAYLLDKEFGRGSVGVTYAWYVVGDKTLGLAQFRVFAAAGEELDGAEGYALTFLFKRGVVEGIYLDYASIGDLG